MVSDPKSIQDNMPTSCLDNLFSLVSVELTELLVMDRWHVVAPLVANLSVSFCARFLVARTLSNSGHVRQPSRCRSFSVFLCPVFGCSNPV